MSKFIHQVHVTCGCGTHPIPLRANRDMPLRDISAGKSAPFTWRCKKCGQTVELPASALHVPV